MKSNKNITRKGHGYYLHSSVRNFAARRSSPRLATPNRRGRRPHLLTARSRPPGQKLQSSPQRRTTQQNEFRPWLRLHMTIREATKPHLEPHIFFVCANNTSEATRCNNKRRSKQPGLPRDMLFQLHHTPWSCSQKEVHGSWRHRRPSRGI